jgi:hypothetical protein
MVSIDENRFFIKQRFFMRSDKMSAFFGLANIKTELDVILFTRAVKRGNAISSSKKSLPGECINGEILFKNLLMYNNRDPDIWKFDENFDRIFDIINQTFQNESHGFMAKSIAIIFYKSILELV